MLQIALALIVGEPPSFNPKAISNAKSASKLIEIILMTSITFDVIETNKNG